jgi:site-specific DNA recombinase
MDRTEQKAVIYCRVSDPKQKTEGHGLESQETRCREYAAQKGYDVIKVYHDDHTGGVADRPAMKDMLAFLKRQRATLFVVIDDLSRLARDVESHAQLRRRIRNTGSLLVSPSHQFREDSDGRFVENVLASSAQHQREKNAEQTMNRMRSRCLDGYWPFKAPTGYRFEETPDKIKILVPDEPVASIVRQALIGYADRRFETQAEVQRFLEAQPSYPLRYRGKVHAQRVYEMLQQILYAGHLEYPKWNVPVRKIQRRMSEVAKAPARRDLNLDFPLRGAVACACGTPLTAYWAKGRTKHYPYYHCHNKACEHYSQTIKRDVIESEFDQLLGELRPSPSLFKLALKSLQTHWQRRVESGKERKRERDLETRKIEKDVTQLLDRVLDTDNPTLIRAYEGRITALERRKAELLENITQSGKPLRDFDASFRTAMEFLANPQKLWRSGQFHHQRMVLRLTLAERIQYVRGSGFRTAITTSPFRVFSHFLGSGGKMVPATGFEPVAP